MASGNTKNSLASLGTRQAEIAVVLEAKELASIGDQQLEQKETVRFCYGSHNFVDAVLDW